MFSTPTNVHLLKVDVMASFVCFFQFVVADVHKYLGQLNELLPMMRETIPLGKQPELTDEANCGRWKFVFCMGVSI